MQKAYKLAIFYYLIFTMLLLLSAVVLFKVKIGFGVDDVLSYYMGNEAKFIIPKSDIGVLKLVLPHILAFGLLGMVLLHFLVFTKYRYKKSTLVLIYLSFLSVFLEIFSPIMIIHEFSLFVYVKLFSLFLFLGLIFYVVWLLMKSILDDSRG